MLTEELDPVELLDRFCGAHIPPVVMEEAGEEDVLVSLKESHWVWNRRNTPGWRPAARRMTTRGAVG